MQRYETPLSFFRFSVSSLTTILKPMQILSFFFTYWPQFQSRGYLLNHAIRQIIPLTLVTLQLEKNLPKLKCDATLVLFYENVKLSSSITQPIRLLLLFLQDSDYWLHLMCSSLGDQLSQVFVFFKIHFIDLTQKGIERNGELKKSMRGKH